MNLLGSANYDPAAAVSKATSSLLALTAVDTTNLRLAITVPSHGKVLFRMKCAITGATTLPGILLGVLNGATVLGRLSPQMFSGTQDRATENTYCEAEFIATGLTPGAMNVDAAYAVQVVVASTNIKYGGPNTNAGANAWGGFVFEAWDPQPVPTATPGAANGLQICGANAATTYATLTSTGAFSVNGVSAVSQTGDNFARLGAPAGASVSADIAAVKVDTAAVKVQTDKLTFTVANQIDSNVLDWKSATAPAMTGDAFARLGAPAGASVSADVAATKALLPTALVSGRMDCSVGAMAANVLTATAINADAITAAKIADGAIDAATFAAGAINAAAIAADAITDAKVASDVTIASVTGAVGSVTGAVASVTGAVGSVTGSVGGNVTGSVGSVATGGIAAASFAAGAINAAAIATDAFGALELAADAATEISTAVWAAATRELTAGTNIVLAKGTGITGFNDLSAAQVNTEADTALSDVGLTATITGRIDAATSTRLATAGYTAPDNATITAIAGYVDTEVGAIKAKTDQLTFTVANQADVNVVDWKGSAAPAMTGDAFARLGAPVGASISADLAAVKAVDDAVKAKTDNLPASPAATGSAMTLTAAYDAAKTAATQISVDDLPTNAELATALAGADDATLAAIAALNNISTTNIRTELATELGRIDVATSTRLATAGYTAPDNADILLIKAKTDNLPSAPADETLIIAATNALAASIAALPTTATVNAIKAKTDNLPLSPAAIGDAMTLTVAYDAAKTAATQVSIDALNDISTADVRTELSTELGRIDVATSTRLASSGYTAPDNADIAAIVAVTGLLSGMLENSTGYRFTTHALQQAPTGGSAPTVQAIADEVQTRTIAAVTIVNGLAPFIVNASALAGDAVIEIQSGLAMQTSLDLIPTNAELAAALAGADDATLAAIGALSIPTAIEIADEVEIRTLLANVKYVNGTQIIGDGSEPNRWRAA